MEEVFKQVADEIHKPIRKHFPTRSVVVMHIDEIWALDLADLHKLEEDNDHFKYLLNIIDCFSRYAWSVPLKDKNAKTVVDALGKVIKQSDRTPKYLWTDLGAEFKNRLMDAFMREHNIKMYSTFSVNKSSMIERWNRTLKTAMWIYFSQKQTRRYIDVLPELVKAYNNRVHSKIQMTPVEGSMKENEGQIRVLQNKQVVKKSPNLLKVGDKVRISYVKGVFEKGYEANWSYEVFTISKVLRTNPTTYHLVDETGEPIQGSFYEPELQKTKLDNVFLVEKVIKTRKVRGKKQFLVKWLGFPESKNSWVDEEDMIG